MNDFSIEFHIRTIFSIQSLISTGKSTIFIVNDSVCERIYWGWNRRWRSILVDAVLFGRDIYQNYGLSWLVSTECPLSKQSNLYIDFVDSYWKFDWFFFFENFFFVFFTISTKCVPMKTFNWNTKKKIDWSIFTLKVYLHLKVYWTKLLLG